MYNVAVVRQLCADIATQEDPVKAEELIDLLHAVVQEDQEEIRIRLAFLAKKYKDAIVESKAAD